MLFLIVKCNKGTQPAEEEKHLRIRRRMLLNYMFDDGDVYKESIFVMEPMSVIKAVRITELSEIATHRIKTITFLSLSWSLLLTVSYWTYSVLFQQDRTMQPFLTVCWTMKDFSHLSERMTFSSSIDDLEILSEYYRRKNFRLLFHQLLIVGVPERRNKQSSAAFLQRWDMLLKLCHLKTKYSFLNNCIRNNILDQAYRVYRIVVTIKNKFGCRIVSDLGSTAEVISTFRNDLHRRNNLQLVVVDLNRVAHRSFFASGLFWLDSILESLWTWTDSSGKLQSLRSCQLLFWHSRKIRPNIVLVLPAGT